MFIRGRLLLNRKIYYVFLALCPVLLFQNCGSDTMSSSLYGSDQTTLDSVDCISNVVDCGSKPEFLLVSIDTPNPLILTTATTSYLVSGRCNTGNYNDHYITYEVRNSSGAVRSTQNLSRLCVMGRYQFNLALGALANNENHSLKVMIIGIDDKGQAFSNALAGGSAQIDFYKQ